MCKNKSIFVVILNFNNELDTIECLKSLESIVDYNLNIVVVDNNSKCPDLLEKYVTSLPNAIFIQTGENKGYAAGNNVGIRYSIENNADYIVILNNDVIVNARSFKAPIDILESDSQVAIAGPTILEYNSNIIQNCGAKVKFCPIGFKNFMNGAYYNNNDKIFDCDSVMGACLIFRADIISKINYIPEDYFLFFESCSFFWII